MRRVIPTRRSLPPCSGGIYLKTAIGLLVFALWGSLTSSAQILPTSSCACGVSSSSTVSCGCLGAAPIKKGDGSTSKQTICDGRRELAVISIVLSHGAVLNRWVPDEDELIIGMGAGELLNEAKSPSLPISMSEGLVLLMPKEEAYLLRNVGKQDLHLLVIRMHPTGPARP